MAKKFVTLQYKDAYVAALDAGQVSIQTPYMNSATASKIDWMDKTTGTHLIFTGEHFKVSHGLIDSGTIEGMEIRAYGGKLLATVSGLHINAQTLSGTTGLEVASDALQRVLNSNVKMVGSTLDDNLQSGIGNDQILGGKGDDTLGGGAGKDIMTGGAGNDIFIFAAKNGKDTITDFDADGGVGQQDLIKANFASVTSIDQVGDNTVIHFGAGDSLTLQHVDKTHIDQSDFMV